MEVEAQIESVQLFLKKSHHKAQKDLDEIKNLLKRKEPEPTVAVPVSAAKQQKQEEPSHSSFICPGRLWESPPLPCVGGEKSTIKDRIRYKPSDNAKNILLDVCRGCKNSKKKRAKTIKEDSE